MVMLTCALRAQVKKLKMEIKNKFDIESILLILQLLRHWMHKFQKKSSTFGLCPKGTS